MLLHQRGERRVMYGGACADQHGCVLGACADQRMILVLISVCGVICGDQCDGCADQREVWMLVTRSS